MKKILRLILNIFFILNVLLLIVSYTFKDIFVNGILIDTVRARITQTEYKDPNLTIDDVITENGVITDNELVNEILQSEEIQELINQYLDQIIDTLIDEEDISNIDPTQLEQSMMEFIKDNKEVLSEKTGIEITNEMVDETYDKLNKEDIKKTTIQSVMNTKNNLSPKEKRFLRLYKILVSKNFKRILWILLAFNILLRMIIEKSIVKWTKSVSILSIISGFLTLIGAYIITRIVSSILGDINIDTTPMNRIGIAFIIIGFIVFIIYQLGNALKGGKHEISKVSIK